MKKVDVPQVLISASAIFGITLLWLNLNGKVFDTVSDLLYATLYDTVSETDSETDAETD